MSNKSMILRFSMVFLFGVILMVLDVAFHGNLGIREFLSNIDQCIILFTIVMFTVKEAGRVKTRGILISAGVLLFIIWGADLIATSISDFEITKRTIVRNSLATLVVLLMFVPSKKRNTSKPAPQDAATS